MNDDNESPLYYVWWSQTLQQQRYQETKQFHLIAKLEDGSEVEYNALSLDRNHSDYLWKDMQLLGRGRFCKTRGRLLRN